MLNLIIANSPVTSNDREKINVAELGARVSNASTMLSPDAGGREQPSGVIDGILDLFQGGKNGLRDIFRFVAYVYLKLTWHDSDASYYGNVANLRGDDPDPTDFLLDVVNDAKTLRNKVEDFLSVPRNTFENEWPTERRLQSLPPHTQRDFEALVAAPLDIKQMMTDLIR